MPRGLNPISDMERFWVFLVIIVCFNDSAFSGVDEGKSLKRAKRYITFPEGSAFSFAFCMTIKAVTPFDKDIFSEAVAVATSYDLPNNSMTLGVTYPKNAIFGLSRRQRSYVYSRAELVLEKIGISGKACVLRAICEGAQQLEPNENMLAEIFRVVLKFTDDMPSEDEPKEQWIYAGAYRSGILNYNCPDLYPNCPISLIDLVTNLKPIT